MKKLIWMFILTISVAIPSFADNEFMAQTAVNIVSASSLQTATDSSNNAYASEYKEPKKSPEELAKEEHNRKYGHDSGSSGGVLVLFALLFFVWLFSPKKRNY